MLQPVKIWYPCDQYFFPKWYCDLAMRSDFSFLGLFDLQNDLKFYIWPNINLRVLFLFFKKSLLKDQIGFFLVQKYFWLYQTIKTLSNHWSLSNPAADLLNRVCSCVFTAITLLARSSSLPSKATTKTEKSRRSMKCSVSISNCTSEREEERIWRGTCASQGEKKMLLGF